MSATLQQIRAAIAAKIAGVAGTGQVHTRWRWIETANDLAALFKTGSGDQPINGWMIQYLATRTVEVALGRDAVEHDWRIRGWLSFSDSGASEETMDTLSETIRHAFRADDSLGGIVGTMTVGGKAGLQVEDAGPVRFCGKVCSSIQFGLTTWQVE